FDNVVVGKGQGLNILLYGNPRLRKTLTAKAVSEYLKRLLYSVRYPLGQIFQIVKHWSTILLLDKADVYLEYRLNQDLVYNSLVSIVLYKLEYYKGIMFLITNRVLQFDKAVLSWIYLILRYNDLNKACNCYSPAAVRHLELEGLAATKFNGYQIKNIVVIAYTLVIKQGSYIQFKYIQRVVLINKKFVYEFYR
ncbi:hypothetical protein OIDMADRAFT_110995, partial [Oidiodendron maius Zn]